MIAASRFLVGAGAGVATAATARGGGECRLIAGGRASALTTAGDGTPFGLGVGATTETGFGVAEAGALGVGVADATGVGEGDARGAGEGVIAADGVGTAEAFGCGEGFGDDRFGEGRVFGDARRGDGDGTGAVSAAELGDATTAATALGCVTGACASTCDR